MDTPAQRNLFGGIFHPLTLTLVTPVSRGPCPDGHFSHFTCLLRTGGGVVLELQVGKISKGLFFGPFCHFMSMLGRWVRESPTL